MTDQTITVSDYSDAAGVVYNTGYIDLTRADVRQVRAGYPAEFDRLEAMTHLQAKLERKGKRKSDPFDVARAIKRAWLDTGVPQSIETIYSIAGLDYEHATAHRRAREAIETGSVFTVDANGHTYYLPFAAYITPPKRKPSLAALSDTQRIVYSHICTVYGTRLIPPSMVEIGEACGLTFANYPVKQLVEAGLLVEVMSGGRRMWVPVGWKAGVKRV